MNDDGPSTTGALAILLSIFGAVILSPLAAGAIIWLTMMPWEHVIGFHVGFPLACACSVAFALARGYRPVPDSPEMPWSETKRKIRTALITRAAYEVMMLGLSWALAWCVT